MILQKEKDLELAAKIGQSLLEQNHELQTRNEFLEEALNASNDVVIQLRHDLQMRSNLLRFYVDYDIDLDGCTAGQSNSENFQRKIKLLEDENQSLKNESTNLKKICSEYEENERLHISEWTKQLDTANEKICHLQHLLVERTEECGNQNVEVERLLREVALRSNHEKALTSETINLHQQLQDALTIHEGLTAQVIDLQERYTEVLAMLHDAEEELRTFRQNQSAYRTGTPDSLYDSLASEIEASDSGFYSAAINSQKISGKVQNMQSEMDMTYLSNKLEMINKTRKMNNSNVLKTTRTVATLTDPLPSDQYQQNSHNDDNVIDVPNNTFAKLLRHSYLSHFPISSLGDHSIDPNTSAELESLSTCKPEMKFFEVNASTSASSMQSKQFFDENHQIRLMYDFNRISQYNSGSTRKIGSNDSLSDYVEPKMGEPGRPGTRDLDWSIQKLNIRKQIEREYARFRRERGLPPSNTSFFNISSNKISRNSMTTYHWSQIIQQQQHQTLSSDELQKHKLTNDLSQIFKRDKILSNIGLFALLHDNLTQGIVLRSTIPITPPVTPVQQKRKTFTGNDISLNSSSYLLEALDLYIIPSKVSPLSLTSKQLAQFHSMHNLHHHDFLVTTTTTQQQQQQQQQQRQRRQQQFFYQNN
uniref:HAP1 N-terminal domain-containing protein n=1 Tax=Loa loa TaxID=7209 RepID=A0A1I7V6L8_LOALO